MPCFIFETSLHPSNAWYDILKKQVAKQLFVFASICIYFNVFVCFAMCLLAIRWECLLMFWQPSYGLKQCWSKCEHMHDSVYAVHMYDYYECEYYGCCTIALYYLIWSNSNHQVFLSTTFALKYISISICHFVCLSVVQDLCVLCVVSYQWMHWPHLSCVLRFYPLFEFFSTTVEVPL